MDGFDDRSLLDLAAVDDRILITATIRDFLPIPRDWAEAGRSHAGCILIASSIRQHQFGVVIAAVAAAIAD